MKTKWQIFKDDPSLTEAFSQELNVSPLIAKVLLNRGIKDLKAAQIFLNPRLANLSDPMEIPGILAGAQRVLLAKERKEKVLVFGDYDVDGVTGTAILLNTLKFLGISATYYIPHRYGEGYSLSLGSVKEIAESGVNLIITVDCGISSQKEIALANSLGMEVIVTDHHTLPKKLPAAHSIINPKLIEGEHPSKHLAGAGVAFKFAWGLLRVAGIKDSEFLTALLDLASLGTISDVVPLTAENRILAVAGLKIINSRKRLGIKHLAQVASLKKDISVNQIYFALAPRINAAGRLEHASKSVELLMAEDPEQAQSLAQELNSINLRRRGIGADIKEEVFGLLSEDYIAQNKVVVLSGRDWHPGVIGIVASQVAGQFFRPAVLVSENNGIGRGSARSVSGVNIFALLNACSDLFLGFGGHSGAAGFEIECEKIPQLKARLKEEALKMISSDQLKPKIIIDALLDPSEITMSLISELDVFDPHGEGNPPPHFMSTKLKLHDMRQVGSTGAHFKAKFTNGEISLDAIGFGMGALADQLSYEKVYDIAYKLEANEWDGFESAQLKLVDVREAQAPRQSSGQAPRQSSGQAPRQSSGQAPRQSSGQGG